jgi:hypothetical protein
MICQTLEYYDFNKQPVFKPKRAFDTLEAAIAVAKIENSKDFHITKLVAYKCSKCFKFHVGRNGKPIKEKYRNKLQKEIKLNKEKPRHISFEEALQNVKVVGFIDLSKTKY